MGNCLRVAFDLAICRLRGLVVRLVQLIDLALNLTPNIFERFPFESGRSRLARYLLRLHQSRKAHRHAIQQPGRRFVSAFPTSLVGRLFFPKLHLVP